MQNHADKMNHVIRSVDTVKNHISPKTWEKLDKREPRYF